MRSRHDHIESDRTIDQVIEEALRRERSLQEYYESTLTSVGPDAREILSRLSLQEHERIETLRLLLAEIRELRELNAPMVG